MSNIAMEVNSLLGKTGLVPAAGGNVLANSAQASSILERTQYYHPSTSGGGGYHEYHSLHGGGNKGGKRSIALTALTLLSFLFFLHILENCIQQQNDMMNPQVVIMQARIKAHHRRQANKRMGEAAPSEETYVNTSVESVKGYDQDSDELYHYAKIPQISPTKFN